MAANSTPAADNTVQSAALMYINLLVPPVLVVLGVTFNWFTILTMRTRYFRKVSTSVYLKVGAFNDFLALLVSLVAHWLYVNFPSVYVRTESSHIMCKFFNFYGSGNNDFGIIVTVSMTAERALVIASPLGAGKRCSVTRAWKVVIVLLAGVILKNCHYLIASDIVPAERTDRLCDVFPHEVGRAYMVFYGDLWPWINLFYFIACGIAILISNSIILHNVRKSFGVKYSGKNPAWRHLVPMLLGESLLLVIFTFPFSFHLALLSIRVKYNPDLYLDEETANMENLVFSITFYMLYSNKCVNFFMYCITGKQFRDGLVLVLMQCACQKTYRKSRDRTAAFRSTTSSTAFSKTYSTSKRDTKSHSGKSIIKDTRANVPLKRDTKIFSAAKRLKISLSKKRLESTNKPRPEIPTVDGSLKHPDSIKATQSEINDDTCVGIQSLHVLNNREMSSPGFHGDASIDNPTCSIKEHLVSCSTIDLLDNQAISASSESDISFSRLERTSSLNKLLKSKRSNYKTKKYPKRIRQNKTREGVNSERNFKQEITGNSGDVFCLYINRPTIMYELGEKTQPSRSVYL